MRALPLLRTLTPWGWALALGGALALALIGLHGLGFRWDPLRLSERRLEAAEARVSVAVADASARRLEVEAAGDQARRLTEVHQQTMAVERATARAATQARSAHDADHPLDPQRAARLADHDRELCRLVPAACAAAPLDPASGGDDAVRADALACVADRGRS